MSIIIGTGVKDNSSLEMTKQMLGFSDNNLNTFCRSGYSDLKKIFKIALDHHSSGLILGHNHPSGNIQSSDADHKITKKIKECGILLDIAILDH